MRAGVAALAVVASSGASSAAAAAAPSDLPELPEQALSFVDRHCLECHDSATAKGDLDLESLAFDPGDRATFDRWVLVHDRVAAGEMPPEKKPRPGPTDTGRFLASLAGPLADGYRETVSQIGRAKVRRLNRFEYENSLRHILDAPWLLVADRLPEDGVDHLFNKSGEQLDVSHVQMARFYETADHALREAVDAAAFPAETAKYYAREEPGMVRNIKYRFGQKSATRAAIPLLDHSAQPGVILDEQPVTVGPSDPETREREALGFVSGTYTATTKYDFTRMRVPASGRYRLRLRTYTFTAAPGGRNGGDDHGLTTGGQAWWRPDRKQASPGERSEPVTLYALTESGDSRWLTTYDAQPEPAVTEHEVVLRRGEALRPDAGRLVRTRPGFKGNPNATHDGVPGFALSWLEVEGPLQEEWPPPSYRAAFGDLPFEVTDHRSVRALPRDPEADARRLLQRFVRRAYRLPEGSAGANSSATPEDPFVDVYRQARELGADFTDAVIAACAAALCSADFLYLESRPGPLPAPALATRLAFFLWNSPPDNELLETPGLAGRGTLLAQAERLIDDPKSTRFVDAFLDYWLDLRELNANAPDAVLYPDYYLDDQLTEASLFETRLFFRELLARDLPARNLVDSDFTFVNERLARHYGLEAEEGVTLRRVALPAGSPRGGLLTQASVLRVTANGTTTSPVIRGAWVTERLLGVHIPPPPSGVEAVEPDTRGATTIREQLDLHRSSPSCNACHAKFDPSGLALESFDVAGGWRDRYRATGETGEPAQGVGKNGHLFTFRHAQPVDSTGELPGGHRFADINGLKQLLLADERKIARNLVRQFVVYATGAPVGFGDRDEVERILDRCEPGGFGVRALLLETIDSQLFRAK